MTKKIEEIEIEMDEISNEEWKALSVQLNGMGFKFGKCLFKIIQVDANEGTFRATILNRKKESAQSNQTNTTDSLM